MKNKTIAVILAFAVAYFTGCSANAAGDSVSSDAETISRPASQDSDR